MRLREPAHAHRDNVALVLDGVLERLRDNAGKEKDNRVCDAQWQNLGFRSASEKIATELRHLASGEDGAGSSAMAGIIEQESTIRVLRAVRIPVGVDEVVLE